MKDIAGYEGLYAVTTDGKVWSYRTNQFLKAHKNKQGYYWVWLQGIKRSQRKHYFIHRLVALTYIPQHKSNKPLEVNHKDGNKANNEISNLEWVTHSENHIHAFEKGLRKYKEKIEWWKWTPKQLASLERQGGFIM